MKQRMTADQAFKMAKQYGIKFNSSDPSRELTISDSAYLSDLAKTTGYKKSASSSQSTGHAFYSYLYKKFA
jgi:hypothetical protein